MQTDNFAREKELIIFSFQTKTFREMNDSQLEVVKWNANYKDYGFPVRLQFRMILYRGVT